MNNNISHNMEKSISLKYMRFFFAFGRNGSRFGPLSLSFYSPLFLLPIMWPWHLGHVIPAAMPFCSYSQISWSLLAGSNACVDVVKFFLNLNCKTKEIFIMIVIYYIEKQCIHNRRELRKTISEKP